MAYFLTALRAYLSTPITWVMFLFGIVIGSFLNVVIARVPAGTFLKRRRSECPHCQHIIPWYLNIPLLSFVWLRGKARCCGYKISWQYPLVELVTGVLFAVSYWGAPFLSVMTGPSGQHFVVDGREAQRFAHSVLLSSFVICTSVIDLRLMIIPDKLSLPMIFLGLVAASVHPELTLLSSLGGILAGGGVLYLLAWLYWLVRKDVGMGMGDVKLLAALGAWLGYQGILPTMFFGSIIGAVFGLTAMLISGKLNLKSALPFGPFLGLGALIHYFAGSKVQEWIFLK